MVYVNERIYPTVYTQLTFIYVEGADMQIAPRHCQLAIVGIGYNGGLIKRVHVCHTAEGKFSPIFEYQVVWKLNFIFIIILVQLWI